MIDGTKMQLGSLEPEKVLPKITSESWISVIDKIMRHAMTFNDSIHENLIHCGCSEWVLKRM
jgi:hypothetical protein